MSAMGVAPVVALAADAPVSYKASPDGYKLISENEHLRVILAAWKPGQRDAWHSHPGQLAAYSLTGCEARLHTSGGKYVDGSNKKGGANFNPIIPSHSLENRGRTECQTVIVGKK